MRPDAALEAALDRLPSDFEVVRGARGVLAVRKAQRAPLLAAGWGPDGDGRSAASDLAGRVPLGEITLGDERLVVRRFQHGGLLRWLSGERFRDAARPFHELALAEELQARGVPTPRAVAARAQRLTAGGWRLALITQRVEGALDVERMLRRLQGEPAAQARVARLFHEVGAFVGRVHGEGFVHTDLTPRNVLMHDDWLVGGEARLWLLDLDRCRFAERLSDADRHAMLARLLRYVTRRDRGPSPQLTRARVARFLRAYRRTLARNESPEGPRAWHADWRAVEGLWRRAARWHRAGWRLEEALGADAERGRRGLASGAGD